MFHIHTKRPLPDRYVCIISSIGCTLARTAHETFLFNFFPELERERTQFYLSQTSQTRLEEQGAREHHTGTRDDDNIIIRIIITKARQQLYYSFIIHQVINHINPSSTSIFSSW